MWRVKKVIDYNLILFPFLWLFTLFLGLVEVFTYAGFFLFGFQLFLALTIMGGWLLKFTSLKEEKKIFKLILIFNRPAFLLFSFLVIFFPILEVTHFPNYVFSVYHIHPSGLFWPWFLSSFLIFLELLPNFKQLSPEMIVKKALFCGLVSLVLAVNIFTISRGVIKSFYFIIRHPFASYDDKMREKIGQQFYDFTLFINQNTPEDARLLIPPQGYPWPQTGNCGYLRYFVYPRHVISGKEFEAGIDLEAEIDYVLLAWGESSITQYGFTHGWPKFDIAAKRIIYKKNDFDKEIVFEDYDYQDPKNKGAWGIIEVEKK